MRDRGGHPVRTEKMSAFVGDADTVLVVDFGAQYAQLIARRVREAGVYSVIVPSTITAEDIAARQPAGVILSGGPASVRAVGAPRLDPAVYRLGVPILGICYGAQLMAEQLGGAVGRNDRGEYGRTELTLAASRSAVSQSDDVVAQVAVAQSVAIKDRPGGVLLGGLESPQTVWMSHFDCVTRPPAGVTITARTLEAPVAAFEDRERGLYAVQFHPEVVHTPCGQTVMRRFLRDACGVEPSWSTLSVIDTAVEAARAQIGSGEAICGLSGGVDSAVAAALVHRAIGDRLTCVLVDTGLLRLNEADQVVDTFRDHDHHSDMKLERVDAADRFFAVLAGVTDPEAKRKAVGEQFIRVFEEARHSAAPGAGYLVQGTLYPDVIESGMGHAATIKSHHNVGGLPEHVDFELVEPLRWLFKDEVRAVGTELGLPEEIVKRQPFPGPGLAVRIIGEVTPDKADTLRQADAIVRSELRTAGLTDDIWQAFAVLPDIRTVGVMGDERTYGRPVAIRAVTGSDAMTADWARLPHEVLAVISSRVVSEVPGVNRVVYDITSKPPATIEWE